jgi:hypothetical protein
MLTFSTTPLASPFQHLLRDEFGNLGGVAVIRDVGGLVCEPAKAMPLPAITASIAAVTVPE